LPSHSPASAHLSALSLHDALPIFPIEADHVSDVRFIPNPYWVPELKAHRGTDTAVAEYVLGDANAAEFVDRYLDMITPVLRGYTDRKSTRLNSSHVSISYAVFCLK